MPSAPQNVNARVANQRYFNKASGHMETAQQMHNYHAPAHHAVPSGHQVASTKHTVVQHPAPTRQPPDWLHMNSGQLLQFAKKLVGDEVAANRVPFQQAERRLEGQEGATRENTERLATQGNQAGAALVASQQGQGQAGEQRAREAQTQAAMPTEAQKAAQEHGVPLSEQGSRQEALLKALGQGGVNQAANFRAAGEKWAQSQQAGYQQMGTAAIQNVGTRFGAERQKNREEESAYTAKGLGQTTKVYQDLLGEQQKVRTAREALGLQAGQKEAASMRTAATAREGHHLTAETARQGRVAKAREGERNRQFQGEQKAKDRDIKTKAARLKAEGVGGKPLSPAQASQVKQSIGGAFNVFASMRGNKKPADWGLIRESLTRGYTRQKAGVDKEGNPKFSKSSVPRVKDQLLITAGEQLYRYHHVDANVRRELEATLKVKLGSDASIYQAMTGQRYSPPVSTAKGVRGGVNAR